MRMKTLLATAMLAVLAVGGVAQAKETVIWIAKVEDNLVSEWRIFSDLDHLGE